MKMILENDDIGEAIVELLKRRGVDVTAGQITLSAQQRHVNDKLQWFFEATIKDVVLPPKEGPYR